MLNTIEKIKLWYLFAIEIIDTQVARRGRQYHSQPTCHLIRNVSKVLYKKKQCKINKNLHDTESVKQKDSQNKIRKKTKKKKKKQKNQQIKQKKTNLILYNK